MIAVTNLRFGERRPPRGLVFAWFGVSRPGFLSSISGGFRFGDPLKR